jgi:plasmid stability protein
MATLTIRNLPDDVRDRLRVRAAQAGRSMEAEARAILCDAVGRQGTLEQDKLAAWYDFQRAVLAGLPLDRRQIDGVEEFLRDKRRDNIFEMIKDGDDPREVFGEHLTDALAEAGLSEQDLEAMKARVAESSQ